MPQSRGHGPLVTPGVGSSEAKGCHPPDDDNIVTVQPCTTLPPIVCVGVILQLLEILGFGMLLVEHGQNSRKLIFESHYPANRVRFQWETSGKLPTLSSTWCFIELCGSLGAIRAAGCSFGRIVHWAADSVTNRAIHLYGQWCDWLYIERMWRHREAVMKQRRQVSLCRSAAAADPRA